MKDEYYSMGPDAIVAYKLLRKKKNGSLGSLFIGRSLDLEIGKVYIAEGIKKKGYQYNPGWHCLRFPHAPHLKAKLANGENRVWAKVIISDYEKRKRSKSYGGDWYLARKMKIVKIIGELG